MCVVFFVPYYLTQGDALPASGNDLQPLKEMVGTVVGKGEPGSKTCLQASSECLGRPPRKEASSLLKSLIAPPPARGSATGGNGGRVQTLSCRDEEVARMAGGHRAHPEVRDGENRRRW